MVTASNVIANRYELLDKIGQGGMGIVFRANDRLNRQVVALKRVTALVNENDFTT